MSSQPNFLVNKNDHFRLFSLLRPLKELLCILTTVPALQTDPSPPLVISLSPSWRCWRCNPFPKLSNFSTLPSGSRLSFCLQTHSIALSPEYSCTGTHRQLAPDVNKSKNLTAASWHFKNQWQFFILMGIHQVHFITGFLFLGSIFQYSWGRHSIDHGTCRVNYLSDQGSRWPSSVKPPAP